MPQEQYRIEGDAGLIMALTQMRKASARKIMRPGISKGLTIAKRAAKANAPKDTGLIKKSIFKKVVGKTRKGGATGYIYVSTKYDTAEYKPSKAAIYYEFGTRNQPPKPFLRSAMSENKGMILRVMMVTGRERLKIEAAKAALKGKSL